MNDAPDITAEIEALHAALTDWLSGLCPKSDRWFEREITGRLHPEFVNIQPSGKLLLGAMLALSLRHGYGRSPEFRIKIRNVAILPARAGIVLATYEEYQRGARNSDRAQNARFSTVRFDAAANGQLIWRSILEVWLPEADHAPENFEF